MLDKDIEQLAKEQEDKLIDLCVSVHEHLEHGRMGYAIAEVQTLILEGRLDELFIASEDDFKSVLTRTRQLQQQLKELKGEK